MQGRQTGVWITWFIVYNMLRHEETNKFLDLWWQQNVQYTTEDQISFPFVAYSLQILPYTLPQGSISGVFEANDMYVKHGYGQ